MEGNFRSCGKAGRSRLDVIRTHLLNRRGGGVSTRDNSRAMHNLGGQMVCDATLLIFGLARSMLLEWFDEIAPRTLAAFSLSPDDFFRQ